MFRQVKSPAYGTGIASNLVSNEERQRYNSGGRVGLVEGTRPWKRIGSMADFDYKVGPYMPDVNLSAYNVGPGDQYEVRGDFYIDDQGQRVYDEEKTDFIRMGPEERLDASSISYPKIYEDEGYVKSYLASQRALDKKKALDREDPTPGHGRTWEKGDDWRSTVHIPGTFPKKKIDRGSDVIDMFDEQETEVENYPQERPDIIDTTFNQKLKIKPTGTEKPDAFETLLGELDKSAEKKKQYGKGKGLMEGAAAAIKWGHAPTAEKRGEAIAEGLTKVGETGMKAATEGMDLKDRAKILGAIEDKKTEGKISVQESKNNYGMELQKEAYRMSGLNKKEAQRQALEDKKEFAKFSLGTRKEQQDDFLQANKFSPEAVQKSLSYYANKPAILDPGKEVAKSYLTEANEDLIVVYDNGTLMQVTEDEKVPGNYIFKNVTDQVNEFLL